MKNVLAALVALGAMGLFGCESKPEAAKPAAAADQQAKPAATSQPAQAAPAESAKPASTGGW
jgi:hypothetical protein